MSTTFFLAFLIFLAADVMAKPRCCDDIKAEIAKKTNACEILCAKGSTLSPSCCKEIENVIKDYQMAYKEFCMSKF